VAPRPYEEEGTRLKKRKRGMMSDGETEEWNACIVSERERIIFFNRGTGLFFRPMSWGGPAPLSCLHPQGPALMSLRKSCSKNGYTSIISFMIRWISFFEK